MSVINNILGKLSKQTAWLMWKKIMSSAASHWYLKSWYWQPFKSCGDDLPQIDLFFDFIFCAEKFDEKHFKWFFLFRWIGSLLVWQFQH